MAGFVVQKHNRCTLERIEKFISDVYFTDVNLRGRLYPRRVPVTSLKHHCCQERITYNDAVARKFSETQVGHAFGKTLECLPACLPA
jgi:alpha-mannosidase